MLTLETPSTILDFGPGDRIHNPTGRGDDHDFLTITRVGRPDRGNLVRVWTLQYRGPFRIGADDNVWPYTAADAAMITGLVDGERARLGIAAAPPPRAGLFRRHRAGRTGNGS